MPVPGTQRDNSSHKSSESTFALRPLPSFRVIYTTKSRLPHRAQQYLHLLLSAACISSLHVTRASSSDYTHTNEDRLRTHPEQDRVIQVVEQLVQISPQFVLFHRFRLWHMFVILLEKRPGNSPEHATYGEAIRCEVKDFKISAACGYLSRSLTRPRCARTRKMGRI